MQFDQFLVQARGTREPLMTALVGSDSLVNLCNKASVAHQCREAIWTKTDASPANHPLTNRETRRYQG